MATIICSVVHPPRPVSLSGVRLPPTKTPTPGIPNPTSEPALRVSLAEKSAGRMTAAASGNHHQILGARPGFHRLKSRTRQKPQLQRAMEDVRFACSAPLMKAAGAIGNKCAYRDAAAVGRGRTQREKIQTRRPGTAANAYQRFQRVASSPPIAPLPAAPSRRQGRRRASRHGQGARSGRRAPARERATTDGSQLGSGRSPA